MKKVCEADGFPQLKVFSGRAPWTLCLNPECPLREERKKRIEATKLKGSKKNE
ncbi:MAG: hypothetical protein IH840_16720 [Candidatus Heimdallarchaeota archaeon]|nr:hypothetical protein [Candidatus Heimdallarchaeota archaeon]